MKLKLELRGPTNNIAGGHVSARKRAVEKGVEAAFFSSDWSSELRRALSDLGATTDKHPGLFPQGVYEIELDLNVGAGVGLKVIIKGLPPKPGDGAAQLPRLTAFDGPEFFSPPEIFRTDTSPTEGASADQAKLSAGMTIEGTAKLFKRSCKKVVSTYQNNCAHYLSDAFIRAGFADLAAAHDCLTARCGQPKCTSGGKRPIRAKDIQCWFLTKDAEPVESVSANTGFYAVHQERQSDGQGHVVILDSGTNKYYGTGWYEVGGEPPDDWKHQYFQW